MPHTRRCRGDTGDPEGLLSADLHRHHPRDGKASASVSVPELRSRNNDRLIASTTTETIGGWRPTWQPRSSAEARGGETSEHGAKSPASAADLLEDLRGVEPRVEFEPRCGPLGALPRPQGLTSKDLHTRHLEGSPTSRGRRLPMFSDRTSSSSSIRDPNGSHVQTTKLALRDVARTCPQDSSTRKPRDSAAGSVPLTPASSRAARRRYPSFEVPRRQSLEEGELSAPSRRSSTSELRVRPVVQNGRKNCSARQFQRSGSFEVAQRCGRPPARRRGACLSVSARVLLTARWQRCTQG